MRYPVEALGPLSKVVASAEGNEAVAAASYFAVASSVVQGLVSNPISLYMITQTNQKADLPPYASFAMDPLLEFHAEMSQSFEARTEQYKKEKASYDAQKAPLERRFMRGDMDALWQLQDLGKEPKKPLTGHMIFYAISKKRLIQSFIRDWPTQCILSTDACSKKHSESTLLWLEQNWRSGYPYGNGCAMHLYGDFRAEKYSDLIQCSLLNIELEPKTICQPTKEAQEEFNAKILDALRVVHARYNRGESPKELTYDKRVSTHASKIAAVLALLNDPETSYIAEPYLELAQELQAYYKAQLHAFIDLAE